MTLRTIHYRAIGKSTTGPSCATSGGTLALIISGAGGWVKFDRDLANALSLSSIDIVAVDALRYFLWKQRSPEELSISLEEELTHHMQAWKDDRLVLIGYSQGADVMPFIARRFSPALRQRICLMVLVGPAPKADFELRLRDLVFGTYGCNAKPLIPEFEESDLKRVLCICGCRDKTTVCPELAEHGAKIHMIPGGHIFRREGEKIAKIILQHLSAQA